MSSPPKGVGSHPYQPVNRPDDICSSSEEYTLVSLEESSCSSAKGKEKVKNGLSYESAEAVKKCNRLVSRTIRKWKRIDEKDWTEMRGRIKHRNKRESLITLIQQLSKECGIEQNRVEQTIKEINSVEMINGNHRLLPRFIVASESLPELNPYLDRLKKHHLKHPSF